MPSKPKRPVLPPATEGDISKVYPFSEGEYNKGVAALNNNKAAGRDDILVEQLNHIGPKIDSYCIFIICMIFLFLQCVSTVIIVYIIISPLNSYLYIHWILDFK